MVAVSLKKKHNPEKNFRDFIYYPINKGEKLRLSFWLDEDRSGLEALGIDLVHFGVLIVVNSMIGLITPPYGILLFVINAVTGIPLREIIREIWGFLGVLLVALAIMVFMPDLILWLPRVFGYQG